MVPGTPKTEFSRFVAESRLGGQEKPYEFEATEAERQALARRLGLERVDGLVAQLNVRRMAGRDIVEVRGRFEAEVVQTCVVTLEPIRQTLSEEFTVDYLLAEPVSGEGVEVIVSLEEDDPPEAVGPDGIDLGEAVVQQLAVCLDPYPRKENVDVEDIEGAANEEKKVEAPGPFEALKDWKGS